MAATTDGKKLHETGKSDSRSGLSSLFHNTPEKMPAAHSIFKPGRRPYFLNQL
jgi:hypothetical protein